AAASVAPPQASVAQRLQELEALHKSGALSAEEYVSKRAQIISDI
ncbi:MAG: SHOCT domain-containing protein, partial [Mycobacterium sp.]